MSSYLASHFLFFVFEDLMVGMKICLSSRTKFKRRNRAAKIDLTESSQQSTNKEVHLVIAPLGPAPPIG